MMTCFCAFNWIHSQTLEVEFEPETFFVLSYELSKFLICEYPNYTFSPYWL